MDLSEICPYFTHCRATKPWLPCPHSTSTISNQSIHTQQLTLNSDLVWTMPSEHPVLWKGLAWCSSCVIPDARGEDMRARSPQCSSDHITPLLKVLHGLPALPGKVETSWPCALPGSHIVMHPLRLLFPVPGKLFLPPGHPHFIQVTTSMYIS